VNEKNLHSIPERECAGCDYHRNCISGYGVSFSSYYFQLNEVNNPYHPMLKMFETGIAGFFIYKLTCKRLTMITNEKR